MTLGDFIRTYRSEHDMNMQDFADLCGLSKAYISILERNINPSTGKPPIPSLETIRAISKVINRDFNEIIAALDSDQMISLEFSHLSANRNQRQFSAVTYNALPLSDEAMELARVYDNQLDTWGRNLVRTVMEQALARQAAETEIILDRDIVRLPLAIQTMGVGIAIPFTELGFETILVEKNEITSKACFAIRVRGNATSCWTDSDILLFEKSMSSTIGAFVIDGLFQILDQEGDKMHLPGSTDTAITVTKNIQRKGYLFNYLNPKWVLGNEKVFPEGYNGPYDMSKL